jgi:hypothetical protein
VIVSINDQLTARVEVRLPVILTADGEVQSKVRAQSQLTTDLNETRRHDGDRPELPVTLDPSRIILDLDLLAIILLPETQQLRVDLLITLDDGYVQTVHRGLKLKPRAEFLAQEPLVVQVELAPRELNDEGALLVDFLELDSLVGYRDVSVRVIDELTLYLHGTSP